MPNELTVTTGEKAEGISPRQRQHKSRAKGAKSVTRAHLCEALCREIGSSRSEASSLVELVLWEIADCLERGEKVMLTSFGSFVIREKGQRIGRNPKTGAIVPVSRRRVIVFRPSAHLKQQVEAGSGLRGGFGEVGRGV
jgi:integration host factor subunit alpha